MPHDAAPTRGGKVKCQVVTVVTPRLPKSHGMVVPPGGRLRNSMLFGSAGVRVGNRR